MAVFDAGLAGRNPELKRYYPTSVLVTGFDIIFFWVARMMMMGIHFMDDVPFRTVFIHTRVLDEKGQKMSKTKGNVVDPLDLIDEYGADALRFTLALAAGQGRDMRIGAGPRRGQPQFRDQAVECRALLRDERMRDAGGFRSGLSHADGQPMDRRRDVLEVRHRYERSKQMLKRLCASTTLRAQPIISSGIVFCDWYLEFAKPIFNGTDEAAKAETRATALPGCAIKFSSCCIPSCPSSPKNSGRAPRSTTLRVSPSHRGRLARTAVAECRRARSTERLHATRCNG